jgi:fused signal recognition particle receptor
VLFFISYVFFFLFIVGLQDKSSSLALVSGIPSWIYLVIAVFLNILALVVPARISKPSIEDKGAEKLLEAAAKKEEKKPQISLVARFQQGLSKTHKGFIGKISAVFSKSGVIDEKMLSELEEVLLGTDIGIKTAYMLFEQVEKKLKSEGIVDSSQAMEIIKTEIAEILKKRENPLNITKGEQPYVIMVTGVNGSGKTTTIAKLSRLFINNGLSVIVAAGDTFRAAAIEQLEHWASKVGADFVKSQEGADPSSVAFDGMQAAIARNKDVLIIDTAGRLHTKTDLMEELKKTKRVLANKFNGSPNEILLVLDATIGQNAIEQTRQFHQDLNITGIVLTKLDGSSKGGVIVGIANEFDIPIRFVGIGEGMDDMQPFNANEFVEALFLDK